MIDHGGAPVGTGSSWCSKMAGNEVPKANESPMPRMKVGQSTDVNVALVETRTRVISVARQVCPCVGCFFSPFV